MNLLPYRKYKSSGVEWLGEVPEHWEVKRLRETCGSLRSGTWGDEPDGENDVVCVRVADFDRWQRRVRSVPTIRAVPHRDRVGRLLSRRDLLIERSGGGEKQAVGCVVTFDHDQEAVCSNFITRLPSRKGLEPRYLCYVHEAAYSAGLTHLAIKQTTGIQNLDLKSYLNLCWCLPPQTEQRKIALYLDRETTGTWALLQAQRSLIERLREKRIALVTRAVTRGLPPEEARAAGFDPAPPLRGSGVEWLSDIPAHWEVKRLKYLATINDEALPDTTPVDQEMQYVDIGSVDSVKGVMTSKPRTFGSAPSRARRIVRNGDTIVSTVGTQCAVAAIREPTANLIVSTGFAVVRPRRMEPGYLSYVARESRFVETIIARSAGVIYPAIQPSEIATIPVPRPLEAEQRAITDYLDRETAKLDRLIGKVETAIERLREYRSALITAVVTGKVDVRGASGVTGRAAAG